MDPSHEVGQGPQAATTQEAPGQAPRLGPEHQRLEAFIGEWKSEGVLGEAAGPQARLKVIAIGRYEWLPGGFFVLHRGEMRFGEDRLESTQIFGFDESTGRYWLRLFDSHGFAREYEGGERDGVWHFAGPHERVTMSFENANQQLAIHWEQSDDGVTWRLLCDLKGTRVH
ncbi:DUF1579 family protein [Corallococcus llansteffanensis]|uniref:DUF1579 domain-containing protein n=1 Tax=Corallococcus llansteffanensis TaxID=2316731 RepID=A0A3A8QVB2_9BACT|nr:DUF1579 family protein [Corallococcus llansteffanensis]RKH67064.1 DUF1579 domain-containing protein [Corallococcus llansteffanensis]